MAATITVTCPNPKCQYKVRASVKHIGRRGKCPACGEVVPIVDPTGQSQSTVTFAADEGARASGGTQANNLLAGLIALVATVVIYGLVFWPLFRMKWYVGILMCDRGFIQPSITLVTCWGFAILALKYWAVRRELRGVEMELELIPLEIDMQINKNNIDKFLGHIGELPPSAQGGILARRIRGALEHFKLRANVSEVQTYLATQADLDASAVDSGYTLVRAFIWVCPILGFIGTVTGISDAVTGLAGTLPTASQSAPAEPGAPAAPAADPGAANLGSKMLEGMKMVTDGLAVAFDTTLVGLVAVVFLMFPAETLKKTEYGMLDRVQEFANESLLRRMSEGDKDPELPEMPRIVRDALQAAFNEHQRWLETWQVQVGKLGQVIGADFEVNVSKAVDDLAKKETDRLREYQVAVKRVEELFQQMSQATASWHSIASGDMRPMMQQMAELQRSMTDNTSAMREVLKQQQELASRYGSGDLGVAMKGLTDAIQRAADTPHTMPDHVPGMLTPTPKPGGGFLGRVFGKK